MIELRNVSYSYHKGPFLQGVNLTLRKNRINVLVGPNGCGKSTVLRLASRLLRPKEGQVLLEGKDLWEMGRRECARRIGHLRQGGAALAQPALEVVLSGRYPHQGAGFSYGREDRDIARQALKTVGAEGLAEQSLRCLSGGERQRVFLAALLAQQAEILLLDEPTTFLDVNISLELMELLQRLREEGKTILLVTHALDLALRFGEHVILMEGGRVVETGRGEALLRSEKLESVFRVRVHRWKQGERCYYTADRE